MSSPTNPMLPRVLLALLVCALAAVGWWANQSSDPAPIARVTGEEPAQGDVSAGSRTGSTGSEEVPSVRMRSGSQNPEESAQDTGTCVVRTFDPRGHQVGGIPVVFGEVSPEHEKYPSLLGVTDANGVLRVPEAERFDGMSEIRFEADVQVPDFESVTVPWEHRLGPIDLVVPDHARIEVEVLGPDGRPWPSSWSLGLLHPIDEDVDMRRSAGARCDERGICTFLVASGRGYRFHFRPDGRREAGLAAETTRTRNDPDAPILIANGIGTTSRVLHQVEPRHRLVTGRMTPWDTRVDPGLRFELHTLERTGEYVFSRLRPFPDGTFATLIARDRGGTLFVLKEPTSPHASIAEPEQPGIHEVHRQDLGSLDLHPPPSLWTGQFLLGELEPAAATFRIESSDEGSFWSAVRSASVHLLPNDRFEVRGLLPDLQHFRIRWTETGMKEPLWLRLHPAQTDVVWDLRNRATARVLIRGHDRRDGPLRVRLLGVRNDSLVEGSGYVDTETDLLAFRFRSLEAGQYFVLIGRETRASHPGRSLQIAPNTNDRYFVSLDR